MGRSIRQQQADLDSHEPFAYEFEVEAYLDTVAEPIQRFDANAYLYLSRAMDWFDVAQHGEDVADAFRRIAQTN